MIDLRTRERKLIAVCVALVCAALVHGLIVSPTLKKRSELNNKIRGALDQLYELKLLQREYDQILAESKVINERVSKRPRDFALFSFLDHTANKLNLKKNLTSLKPSRKRIDGSLGEDIVEVKLEGISLENLVTYLYEIEGTGAAIAIASIRIQPESRLEGGLNVSMMVTSIGTP